MKNVTWYFIQKRKACIIHNSLPGSATSKSNSDPADPFLQGSNGDVNIENRFVGTGGEGDGEVN